MAVQLIIVVFLRVLCVLRVEAFLDGGGSAGFNAFHVMEEDRRELAFARVPFLARRHVKIVLLFVFLARALSAL